MDGRNRLRRYGFQVVIVALAVLMLHIARSEGEVTLDVERGPRGADLPAALSAILRDGDPRVRGLAIQIVQTKYRGAQQRYRTDAYTGVCRRVLAPPAMVDVLIGAMREDEDPAVRQSAAMMLSTLGFPKALDTFVQALEHPDPSVQRIASQYLASVFQQSSLDRAKPLPELAEMHKAARDKALDQLRSGTIDLKLLRSINQLFPPVGDGRAVKPLVQHVKKPDVQPHIRSHAIQLAAMLGDEALAEDMRAILSDSSAPVLVRAAAAEAFVNVRDAASLAALLETLKDPGVPGVVKAKAAKALMAFDSDEVAGPLLEALGHPDQAVRSAALQSLYGKRDKDVDRLVIEAAGHEDPVVREQIALLLGARRAWMPEALTHVLGLLGDEDERVRTAAARVARGAKKPEITEELLAMYDAASPAVRASIVLALEANPDPRVVPLVTEAAGSKDGPLRLAAIRALGRVRGPKAFGILQNALQDESSAIREAATVSLGSLGDQRAGELLFERTKNSQLSSDERLRALAALAAYAPLIGPEQLLPLLSHEDPRFRGRAVQYLAMMKERSRCAVPALIGLLGDSRQQYGAWHALKQITGQSFGRNDAALWRKWWEENK